MWDTGLQGKRGSERRNPHTDIYTYPLELVIAYVSGELSWQLKKGRRTTAEACLLRTSWDECGAAVSLSKLPKGSTRVE